MAVKAWATQSVGKPLEPFEYDPGSLGAEDVEIAVETCGICRKLSTSRWRRSTTPFSIC